MTQYCNYKLKKLTFNNKKNKQITDINSTQCNTCLHQNQRTFHLKKQLRNLQGFLKRKGIYDNDGQVLDNPTMSTPLAPCPC